MDFIHTGVDTTDVEKADARPGFMQHFDKKDEHKKKIGKKQDPNGPHDISYYFPDIPEGMDFRDFVRILYCSSWEAHVHYKNLFSGSCTFTT